MPRGQVQYFGIQRFQAITAASESADMVTGAGEGERSCPADPARCASDENDTLRHK